MSYVTNCSATPFYDGHPGRCGACGDELTGRRTQWCSDPCSRVWARNHIWTDARAAALRRDNYTCVHCQWRGEAFEAPNYYVGAQAAFWSRTHWMLGAPKLPALEVNHIDPRNGAGYGTGCWNHLDNLESLCHWCHVKVTNEQRRARKGLPPIEPKMITRRRRRRTSQLELFELQVH